MHRVILSAIIIMALAAIATAQTNSSSKYEVFGGFSIASLDTGLANNPNIVNPGNHESSFGFETSVTGYLKHNLGIEGDFDGHFKSKDVTFVNPAMTVNFDIHSFNFMGGPHYRFTSSSSTSKLTPFVRALFGGNRSSTNNDPFTTVGGVFVPGTSASETDFAMKLGGGLDYDWKEHCGVRFGADYNPIFQKPDGNLNPDFGSHRTRDDFVFSVGVVFK
jgi:opacity protein-like surface antigen